MVKTHPKSAIIQFHHHSRKADQLLGSGCGSSDVVLQLEPVEHKEYDFIAEIVKEKDYLKEDEK